MKTFALDLWHDLREKRLWPVALLLALALVAVPLALRDPAEEPPAPASSATPAPPDDSRDEVLAVKALAEGELPPSDLRTFSPKNPFKPLVKERSVEEVADQLGVGEIPAGSGEVSGGSPSAGSGAPSGDDGGGTGGTGSPDTGGDTPDDGGDKEESKTTEYTYVIDVTFVANGRKRRIDGMEKLDILPSQASPLLIFMGVSDSGGNAVFLVDSTLDTVGEGKCTPSRDECAFLYLGAGSEQAFTSEDGNSYTLLVNEIRRVKVGAAARSSKRRDETANAAVGAPPAARRFVVPLLTDIVSVSSGADVHSNSDGDRR